MFGMKAFYMEQEGEGGNAGGAIPADVQAIIDAKVTEAVTGLKSKNSELLGKLKETGDRLKSFDGIDPDAVRSMLQKFSDDDEAKLIASGKVDEVLTKRAERMKSEFAKEVQTAKEEAARFQTKAEKFSAKVMKGEVLSEASAAGVGAFAMEDAELAASRMFTTDDEGNPVARDGVLGKDGKPLTLKEWFAEIKETRPHWFPAPANGGGAGHGQASGKPTISQAAFDALPAKQRAAQMAAGVQIV
jgi:hypothetical protein